MPIRVHAIAMGLSTAYLVENEAGLVLVDAGCPRFEKRVLQRVRSLGYDSLGLIFITHAHFDHYGSAAALRRCTGAPIAIHRAGAGAMARGETPIGSVRGRGWVGRALLHLFEPYLGTEPTPPDLLLDDGDDVRPYGLDAWVLHTPGHTAGSSCLIVDDRVAFVGDLLSTSIRPHAQRLYATDWSLIPPSLDRLQSVEPEWVYSGHGRRPVSGDALRRLSCKTAV